MKVILYIGHHKVGSTALQQFLAKNSFRLLENGILYPATESEGLSYMIAKSVAGRDFDDHLPINIREPHNALAFRLMAQLENHRMPPFHTSIPGPNQIAAILQNQFTFLDPETVLICSEVLANFGGAGPQLIDQLLAMLGDVDLEIYCALRRPDDYLASWHGQRLKFGHKLKPLSADALDGYVNSIHFNYRKMLEPWLKRCPDARLHIRNYADILRAGGSVADFMARTDIGWPDNLIPVDRANPSIPVALREIIRRGNHQLAPDQAEELRHGLMALRRTLDLPADPEIELFGAENRQRMYDAFQPHEAFLREVTGQTAFFPDLDQMLIARPMPEAEATAIALDQIAALRHAGGEGGAGGKSGAVAEFDPDPAMTAFLDALSAGSGAAASATPT
ncbi:hypothetical protein [Shimia biformata]|uniref:hypothetical protein n=1 Tax=Shimia biformata TaxID=1294299 RepID=UPI00194EBE33|nr:hypothetical protein [Shimia biformata]